MAKTKKKHAPAKAKTALARLPIPDDGTPMSMFARIAQDKTIDVDKLGKLIELQKDMNALQARAAYEQAFGTLQQDLPVIAKKGAIRNKSGGVQSRYAKLEDIQDTVMPILHRHGFTLRHRTEWPRPGIIRIVGILSHVHGHHEESAFEGPADASDYRTVIQSMGSTVSYGRRYTTIDLLNLTQRGVDNDGQGGAPATRSGESTPPASRRRDAEVLPAEQRSSHADEGEKITLAQRQRLAMIVNNSARSDAEVEDWLRKVYGITNAKPTRDIRRGWYDEISRAIEAPGALPERRS